MEHPIERYIREEKLEGQADFARRVGLSRGFVNDLLRGRALCGRVAARKIVDRTGGKIRLEEMLTGDGRPRRSASRRCARARRARRA